MRSLAVLLVVLVALATAGGGDEKQAAAPAKPTVTPFPTIDRADLAVGKFDDPAVQAQHHAHAAGG